MSSVDPVRPNQTEVGLVFSRAQVGEDRYSVTSDPILLLKSPHLFLFTFSVELGDPEHSPFLVSKVYEVLWAYPRQ